MSDLGAVRLAIANAVNGISTTTGNLTGYATYPPSYVFPCMVVDPYSKSAAETFDGGRSYVMYLHVYVRATDLTYGQAEIDPLLSDQLTGIDLQAIEDVLQADPTLGGAVEFVTCIGWPKPGGIVTKPVGGVTVFGWTLELETWTGGTG